MYDDDTYTPADEFDDDNDDASLESALDPRALERKRERLLRVMDAIDAASPVEHVREVQTMLRKFWGLVQDSAASLPETRYGRMTPKQYMRERVMATRQHHWFDLARTHYYHQSAEYKRWKKKYNAEQYKERLKAQRSTPLAKAQLAWRKRLERAENKVIAARVALVDGASALETDAQMAPRWAALECQYGRYRELDPAPALWSDVRHVFEALVSEARADAAAKAGGADPIESPPISFTRDVVPETADEAPNSILAMAGITDVVPETADEAANSILAMAGLGDAA